jgi:hypothetical protein
MKANGIQLSHLLLFEDGAESKHKTRVERRN